MCSEESSESQHWKHEPSALPVVLCVAPALRRFLQELVGDTEALEVTKQQTEPLLRTSYVPGTSPGIIPFSSPNNPTRGHCHYRQVTGEGTETQSSLAGGHITEDRTAGRSHRQLLGAELRFPKSCTEVLTPGIHACDLTWKQSHCQDNQIKRGHWGGHECNVTSVLIRGRDTER